MTDLHSHILYGLDDGARNAEESVQMLEAAASIGVTKIVATPHVRRLPFERERAVEHREALAPRAAALGIALELGVELHWNVLLALEEASYKDYCFSDSSTLLLEFSLSSADAPQGHEQMIYRLQRHGIHVIIAHPERYPFVQRDPDVAARWHDMGCSLQLDAVCLKRNMEPGSKRAARKLFSAGLADYLASDAHCAMDYTLFDKALSWARKHE